MSTIKESRGIVAIYDKIVHLFAYLCGVLIGLITLSVTADVIVRKVWNTPLFGVVVCSEHALVFITFLGAAWVLKQDGHVRLDLLLGWLDPKRRALLNIITSLLGAAMCMFISYRGILTVWDLWQRHIETVKALELPMAPLYTAICVGSFMISLQFLRKAYGYLTDWRDASEKS